MRHYILMSERYKENAEMRQIEITRVGDRVFFKCNFLFSEFYLESFSFFFFLKWILGHKDSDNRTLCGKIARLNELIVNRTLVNVCNDWSCEKISGHDRLDDGPVSPSSLLSTITFMQYSNLYFQIFSVHDYNNEKINSISHTWNYLFFIYKRNK